MSGSVEKAVRAIVTNGLMQVAAFNRARPRFGAQANPYLEGVYAPVDHEATIERPAVEGQIPADLDGCYMRNGPNPIAAKPATYHWFTGDGMVHGVRLRGGEALWYRNRWIRSTAVSRALGESPVPGPRNGDFEIVNTNVLGHAGKIWALVEASAFPVRLDGELNTIAHDPFDGTLHGSFTAHPHVDPDTGEAHAICYDAGVLDAVRYVVVGADGKVRRDQPIAVKHGPSIHDCMITENYVIVLDLPVTFSMRAMLAGQTFPYAWNPSHAARVGLLPRKAAGDIVWCSVEPCYVFHPANAFETPDGRIVMDSCVHDRMFARSAQGPDSSRLTFERWTIDPQARNVERRVLDETAQEFPRINESRIGKPYRYAYAMSVKRGDELVSDSRLFKHDLETGAKDTHDFGAGKLPGEFVFVPRRGGAAEDDGWLVGFVLDADRDTTDFVILDAQKFAGPPQAVVRLPCRIPPGFHGNWIPDPQ